jgi:ssDNA-binding Zn-finger/Zn-ribbon topoisomerase 1
LIFKELDPFKGSDKFAVAGRRAEEQMAHYLKRFFGGSPEVDVLNYLRIDLQGEVAQMDHLVLHPFGLTIVESKSVAGSVQIKDDGQWIRWFNKQPQGMRSPVTQARMQAMLLRELLARTVKQKGFFDAVDFDVLVAISDSGTIQWPSSGSLPEVCKADQVPEKVLEKVEQRRVAGAGMLSSERRRAISDFLRSIHLPLQQEMAPESAPSQETGATPAAVNEEAKPQEKEVGARLPAKACKHCGGADLDAQYGKFGYYFACKACEKNTGIKFSCPACAGEGRIRKQGKEFFAECKTCEASALFHTNE